MGAGQGDQAGARSERGGDELGGDFAGLGGLEVTDDDAAAAELDPWIDVGRIVAVVAEDLVTFLPGDAIGKEREAERGRSEQGDFIGLRTDELRADAASKLDV